MSGRIVMRLAMGAITAALLFGLGGTAIAEGRTGFGALLCVVGALRSGVLLWEFRRSREG